MTRNVQEGPSDRIAHHLSVLAAAKRTRPASEQRRSAADRALGDHRQKDRGIRDLHHPVHVAGRLDAAARALRPLVGRRASRLDQHRQKDDRGNQDGHQTGHDADRSQSPACVITACRTPGRDARAERRGGYRRAATDERAQRAVEPPLARRTRAAGAQPAARARRSSRVRALRAPRAPPVHRRGSRSAGRRRSSGR